MKFYDFSEEQAKEAIYKYREYFASGGLFENRVYEGIPEMLGKLKASGKKLYVATSKPEKFARQILEHFQLQEKKNHRLSQPSRRSWRHTTSSILQTFPI